MNHRTPRNRSIAGFALALTLGAACTPANKPPGDPFAASEPPPPPQTLSRFNVPLDYDFTPVMATVEREVPKTFGSLKDVHPFPNDPRKRYAFEAVRGPFTAFVVGSQVHLRTTLSYAARGYYNPRLAPEIRAGCGSESDLAQRPRIVVELVTPLTIDSLWNLKSRARLVKVERASTKGEDQCQMSILRLDVTDKVVDAARKALIAQMPVIDRKIAAVSLDSMASGWWQTLNRPIRLRDDVWLLLHPARLRLGKIIGAKRVLTIQAGVDAYPQIMTGAEPAVVMSPLPKLGGSPGTAGFNIVIDGNIDYRTISKTLTDLLRGKTITAKGHTVAIQSVSASGKAGGRLELGIDFAGDSKGTLHLGGAPKYDAAAAMIHVPDLDYDLDTDSKVVGVVAAVKSDEMRALLREKARIPVGPVIDRGKDLLTSGLNRTIGTALTMAATVDSVTVHDLYVRRPGIVVRAAAMGSAKVAVNPKPARPSKAKKR
jgi:hypothetical protein